jgi:hypothetical protein
MAGNLAGFDASTVEPTGAFEPIPADWYPVIITESTRKPTKSGGGEYLELKLQVISGKYQNRTLFDRLNLKNSNDQTVQIAMGTLSAICRAVNVLKPQDSSQLHSKPLMAKVAVKKGDDNVERNEIKGYKAREVAGSPAAQQMQMMEEAFEPQATAPAKPPGW